MGSVGRDLYYRQTGFASAPRAKYKLFSRRISLHRFTTAISMEIKTPKKEKESALKLNAVLEYSAKKPAEIACYYGFGRIGTVKVKTIITRNFCGFFGAIFQNSVKF